MSGHFPEDDEYRGQIDLALWRRILRHAAPYRRQLIGLAASGLLVAMLDVLFPLITAGVIDEAAEHGVSRGLVGYGAAYFVLIVFFSGSVWIFIRLAGQTATGIAYDLRKAGFARLQELSFSYFDTRPVGWLVTRLTADCSKLSSLVPWFMLDLFYGTSMIIGILAAMLWLHWSLALIVMAIVPPLAIASVFFQRRLLHSSRMIRKTASQMTASFNECLMGVRTTKTLVREHRNLDEFSRLSATMQHHALRNALQSAVYLPLVILIGSAGVGLALWRGSSDLGGTLTLGQLIAFMQYAAAFSMPIQELARRFTELQSAQAAAERVQSLLDTQPQINDAPDVLAAIADESPRSPGIAPDGGPERIESVEFRNVEFWYKPGETVLHTFNLTVHAGQTVALVGATGGGKSTIVNLVGRFYEPPRGEVLLNGVDYRHRSLHWLRSSLGVVHQTPHLFSGTVRENIRYGRLDATDDEIEAACRLVNAHDFIKRLDKGYGAEVGEGGNLLSTGQRQLVALARAVVGNPQIFIMDEATSSIDTETEGLIQGAIESVLSGRIAFVIAHRLSTIRAADVILVIEHGRIVERGEHAQLLAEGGRYAELYHHQFVREGEAAALRSSDPT